ncbi:hypothetical protein K501DRAFT_251026 [Backusella circina FSU 941]|nr:hypothetical protein K501DRAFT_251026 [Backusella circina FSU 941]
MAEKRHSKPLPVIQQYTLDDSSRQHISNLLKRWLLDEKVPLEPWFNVLYNIIIVISEKTFTSSESNLKQKICIQTISASSPTDSKFLPNVFHGSNKTTNDKTEEHLPIFDFPIGGTVRIYGSSGSITSKLVDIVSAMIYVIQSLCLEYFLMRDQHVKLIHGPSTQLKPPTADKSDEKANLKQGFLSWLIGSPQKKRTDTTKKSIPEKRTSAFLKRGLSFGNITKKFESDKQIPSYDYDQVVESTDPQRFSKLKKRVELALISSSPDCFFPYPTLLNRLDLEVQLLQEQKRIYFNEITQSKLGSNHNISETRPRRASTLLSTINLANRKRHSYHADELNNSPVHKPSQEDLDSVILPQFITAYSSFRSSELLGDSRFGLEHLLLDTFTLKGFKQHQSITVGVTCYPIGCPERPCFGPIMSKMDYFKFNTEEEEKIGNLEGEQEPQEIRNMDQTLGSVIRNWCEKSRSSCQTLIDESKAPIFSTEGQITERPGLLHSQSRKSMNSVNSQSGGRNKKLDSNRQCSIYHACQQPLMDHVFCITHGTGKFNVYMDLVQMEEEKAAYLPDVIESWFMCNKCDVSTMPQKLHALTEQFSFGKFLELSFYSTRFSTFSKPMCQHKAKSDLIRCFRLKPKGVTIKFVYEEAKRYELRVPRIQVGDIKESLYGKEPRMNPAILRDWKLTAIQEIEILFHSVTTHLDLLNRYILAEGKRKCRGLTSDLARQHQTELKTLETEISEIRKKLKVDQNGLLQVLSKTDLNELNDFRRYFGIQSNSILEYLSTWQKKAYIEVMDNCNWIKPDYIESKNIHCFPGSSILVREDEPTSIIAYTLSSNAYLQEIFSSEDSHIRKEDNEAILATSNGKNRSVPSLTSSGSESEESSDSNTTLKPQILDGYYSSIERKFISSSTGSSTETASFRTMLVEVCKTSVSEAQMNHSKRVEDLKSKWQVHSPWIKKQEESKVENRGLKREFSERDLEPLSAVEKDSDNISISTKEFKATSYYYEPANDSSKNSGDDKKMISPHISYKFVHDNTEFTCIVYYAKEFEQLRKQCDINQLVIESLSRCDSWAASGGKSKSHFYKTKDDKLVVKQMVNAWNIAEKDAFLKFAPKYFEHMNQSSNLPSVLAKIFGFFTIRIKNTLDKKETLDMDVLIMEHLFFGHQIIKKFDFKGIQDRHVEESRKQQKDITLWDGDWLDEHRMHLPVNEQSKAMIQTAIQNDTEFLSKSNIMDYSLLVGIDKEKGEMTAGVVDFIGTYTWYKKIESRSKSTLRSSRKEVTVVPPEQYKERFDREVCDYFIPVPGKFDHVQLDQIMPSLLNHS